MYDVVVASDENTLERIRDVLREAGVEPELELRHREGSETARRGRADSGQGGQGGTRPWSTDYAGAGDRRSLAPGLLPPARGRSGSGRGPSDVATEAAEVEGRGASFLLRKVESTM